MLLNDLDNVIRAAGVPVTEAAGWLGHNHGQLAGVYYIVVHHTGGAATGDYPSFGTVRNGRPDLAGPLAQLGVGRTGRAYVFSNGVAYHAGEVKATLMDNQHSIGIEVESTGKGPVWPAVQVQNTARVAAALCRKYGVPSSRVLGHKEVCSPPGRKIDPVGIPGDMPAFRKLVQQFINGGTVTTPADFWNYHRAGDPKDASQLLKDAAVNATNARSEATNAKTAANAANGKADAALAKGDAALGKLDILLEKVEDLAVGGGSVDVAALAKAVADEQARRLVD